MDNGTTGIRVVVRNAEGCLVDGCCEAVKADNSLVVEAIAVRKGLKVAIEKKYQKAVLEMDSRVVHYEVIRKKRQGIGRFGQYSKNVVPNSRKKTSCY